MEWSKPRLIEGMTCRQGGNCSKWFGIGWYQYHTCTMAAHSKRSSENQPGDAQ